MGMVDVHVGHCWSILQHEFQEVNTERQEFIDETFMLRGRLETLTVVAEGLAAALNALCV